MHVKITKINPLKPDSRGLAFGFSTRPSSFFIVLHRKKGTVSGRHYHKGLNPETFYVAKGTVKLVTRASNRSRSEEHVIEKNHLFEIPPLVYHELHALTDLILLEFHVKDDSNLYEKDTVRPKG
jgi:mannose-6-phosphate isomerase-like protein (cupin superfamily)